MVELNNDDDWKPWAKHVLITIEELKSLCDELKTADNNNCNKVITKLHELEMELTEKINMVKNRITVIETKATILGAGAGFVVGIIGYVLRSVVK